MTTSDGASWSGTEFWHGAFLYVPGMGDQEMLKRSTYATKPTLNSAYTFPVVTRNNWAIRCLSTLNSANGGVGEGFVAVSPDGTEYRFDWLVTRMTSPLTKSSVAPEGSAVMNKDTGDTEAQSQMAAPGEESVAASGSHQLNRVEAWILPTLITDRHGNTVTFTYDTVNKWQLKTIEATDIAGSPRRITLSYVTPSSTASNLVSSVTDGSRTWTYQYNGTNNYAQLQTVVLPDQTKWQLGGIQPLLFPLDYLGEGSCDDPGMVNPYVLVGSMTHPSGATGEFTLTPTRHGRSGVEYNCRYDLNLGTYSPVYSKYFDSYALTKKSIWGPGLTTMTWSTSYSPAQASWGPCNGCDTDKTVTVTDPEGNRIVHTFGTLFRQTEGQPQQVDVQDHVGNTLRTTTMQYAEPIGPFGSSPQGRGDGDLAARNTSVSVRTTTQQGASFTWRAYTFNEFGLPAQVERSSPYGSRVETTLYENNTKRWVLNQVKSVTESSGKVMVANQYDPEWSNLTSVSRFGQLQSSMTYYSNGLLNTETDGKLQSTSYSNYKRGIAQTISYHNGQSKSAVVDNIGNISSLTNEVAATTSFGYDVMGRLSSVSHPAGDTVGWAPATILTWQSASGQFDLGANHWREQISTGTARTVTYYDALWRLVYVERWDDNNVAGTLRTTKYQYDSASRRTFESYPKRTYGEIGPGVYITYDALGRETVKAARSEAGDPDGYARTRTSYDYGFKRTVTDPRNNASTYSYQAFDEPSYDAITSIAAPEGVTVSIGRDVFGKPTSITRGDAAKSVTRYYVYDGAQRLCKAIEPETGATVQDYDAAGNLSWRATGLALPSLSACDTASVGAASKISYQYDVRNRPIGTSFGDGSPAISITLTGDGLPETLTSGGAVWTNIYNKRRLLETEQLTYGGVNYAIRRAYDANGSLRQLTYPDNVAVDYAPNALGEATKVGNSAMSITYHPNDAVAGFVYGPGPGGITHTMTQNVRGLPERWIDGAAINDDYRYDANGNVASITDLLSGGVATRTMGYDNLDRLKSVVAPALWGTASYTYDAADNLTGVSVSAGPTARTTIHNFNSATNRLDSITNGPPGFNVSYYYDARGNVVQRNTQTFDFDLANRLRAAPGRATYAYDARYRRVSTVGTDGVNRVQVYSGDGKLLYVAPTSGTATKYVYLGNRMIAEVGGSAVTYAHTDALGSPVAQSDTAGAVVSRTRYEPYGYIMSGTPRTIGFTGHVNDNETGLIYMQHRYYDAVGGRFLSIDPVVTDASSGKSFNRYAYANNNPYKYIDPDGREPGQLTAWPVPSSGVINKADKPGEGDGHFGTRRAGGTRSHTGIDIQAANGAKVVAAGDGKVVNIQPNPSATYGSQVVIDHGNGVFTQSAHLGSTSVKTSEAVSAGQEIGTAGRTGNTPKSGDTHLHFEVRIGSPAPVAAGGKVIDPMKALPPPPTEKLKN